MDERKSIIGVSFMNSIIIVSDSHGLEEELHIIKNRHMNEASAFIHCGDSELLFDSEEMDGFYKVRGNCDFDRNYPKDLAFIVEGLNIFVTHGHLYNVKMNLLPITLRAQEEQAQLACFGHSHVTFAEKINGTWFINPGSIRMPRGGICGRVPTYVKFSWDEHKAEIEFLDINGSLVKSISENW
jgi:uncharacterized protein